MERDDGWREVRRGAQLQTELKKCKIEVKNRKVKRRAAE
jgi:hypothetical protein